MYSRKDKMEALIKEIRFNSQQIKELTINLRSMLNEIQRLAISQNEKELVEVLYMEIE